MINERAEPNLHSWERQILLGVASLLLVVLVAYGKSAIGKIDNIADSLEKDRIEQSGYRILMERRLTIVEQRQEVLIQSIIPRRSEYVPNHIERSPDPDAKRR